MTTDRCDRTWQVEALEDGRLEPKDGASFARHAQACPACTTELDRLRALRELMAEAPTAERSDLERRRARIALLGAANQRVVERQSPARKARIWALAAALPVLALSAAAVAHYALARSPHGFEVADVAHADWSASQVGATSRVTLRSGIASFHVEHVAPGARFLVALPDGELEVRGTRFVVEVASGQTRSVLVTEGVVALRVGGAEHVLRASERWRRGSEAAAPSAEVEAQAKATAAVPTLPTAEPPAHALAPSGASSNVDLGRALSAMAPKPIPARAPAAQSSTAIAGAGSSRPAPAVVTSARPAVSSAGARFAEAIAAFGAGDYGRADTLLGAFSHDFPSDSRAEDAAFLRADARARRGDKPGAAAAARAYLQAYPNGLRRPAAERLAETR